MLRMALAEQEAELRKLEAELAPLRALQARRDNLHQLVAQMRFNLGMEPYTQEQENTQESNKPIEARAIWVVAREVLERSNVPLSPGDIANTLRGLGFTQLAGRSGKETVRSALVKKKDIFTRLSDGRFELKKPGDANRG